MHTWNILSISVVAAVTTGGTGVLKVFVAAAMLQNSSTARASPDCTSRPEIISSTMEVGHSKLEEMGESQASEQRQCSSPQGQMQGLQNTAHAELDAQ